MSALQPHYSLHTTSYQEEDYDYDPPVTTLPPIKKAESVSITSISDALRPHIPAEVKLVELSKKVCSISHYEPCMLVPLGHSSFGGWC